MKKIIALVLALSLLLGVSALANQDITVMASSTPLYRNFRSRKTKHFPKLFQKMFSLLYRTFSDKKRKHFFKKVSYSYNASFFEQI